MTKQQIFYTISDKQGNILSVYNDRLVVEKVYNEALRFRDLIIEELTEEELLHRQGK